MPDKPLKGQGAGDDISILGERGGGEGKVGRRQKGEKGGDRRGRREGEGESDCEDGRGRGCREATGIGSLHWFLV